MGLAHEIVTDDGDAKFFHAFFRLEPKSMVEFAEGQIHRQRLRPFDRALEQDMGAAVGSELFLATRVLWLACGVHSSYVGW
jgi:hypothetical protein